MCMLISGSNVSITQLYYTITVYLLLYYPYQLHEGPSKGCLVEMGISGLLPVLKEIQVHGNISEFRGKKLAVDVS